MCTVLLPPGDNPIAINKYIKKEHHVTKKYGEVELYLRAFFTSSMGGLLDTYI
jgi:hypothetical protein